MWIQEFDIYQYFKCDRGICISYICSLIKRGIGAQVPISHISSSKSIKLKFDKLTQESARTLIGNWHAMPSLKLGPCLDQGQRCDNTTQEQTLKNLSFENELALNIVTKYKIFEQLESLY